MTAHNLSADEACSACGEPNRAGAKFCKQCGLPLAKAQIDPPRMPSPAEAAPQSRESGHVSETPLGLAPRDKRSETRTLVGALLALVIVGVLGVWLRGAAHRAGAEPTSATAALNSSEAGSQRTSDEPAKSPSGDQAAPPPPVWPISGSAKVLTTSTLAVNDQTVALDGINGVSGPLAEQMEAFLREQGGSVRCVPQGTGAYKCTTTTGYDVAAAALVNGAARAAAGASPAYVTMQDQAKQNHRGVWK